DGHHRPTGRPNSQPGRSIPAPRDPALCHRRPRLRPPTTRPCYCRQLLCGLSQSLRGSAAMINIDDIMAAAENLRGKVRRTPSLSADALKTNLADGAEVVLKLELLQVT